jgi:hypothetical protein
LGDKDVKDEMELIIISKQNKEITADMLDVPVDEKVSKQK